MMRCAWCGRRAHGTAIDIYYDPYYGWIEIEEDSCGDWGCGDEFIDYYDL